MVTSLFSQVLGTTEQPFWLPNLRIQLLSDQLALDHVDNSPLTCLRLDCNGSKSREGTYWLWIGCLAIKSDQKEVIKFLRICRVQWLRNLSGNSPLDKFKMAARKSKTKNDNEPNPLLNAARRMSLHPGAKL